MSVDHIEGDCRYRYVVAHIGDFYPGNQSSIRSPAFFSPLTLVGEGAGERGTEMRFLQRFSRTLATLSLTLSHKWGERSEGGEAGLLNFVANQENIK